MEPDSEPPDLEEHNSSNRLPVPFLFLAASVCLIASGYAWGSIISRNAGTTSLESPGGVLIAAGERASTGMAVFAIITLIVAAFLGLWGLRCGVSPRRGVDYA